MNAENSSSYIPIVVILVISVIFGVVISSFTPQVFPTQASAEAEQVDNLFRVLLGIGGAIFFLVQGALVWSIVAYRAKPDDDSDAPHIHGNTTLEIVWTAIPAVIVFVLAVLSFQVWTSIREEKANEQIVEVVGQRFNWSFTYAIPEAMRVPDGPTSITVPELHVYLNRPVKLEMTTPDVIHSFWVPAMRVKQDLLPGRTTEVRFTPVELSPDGGFPVVCAELCGGGHGGMRSAVIVHEDEAAFNAWLENALPESGDPAGAGRQLLESGALPCAGCHTLDELGWTGQVGPPLNDVFDTAARRVPGLTAEEYIMQSIREPGAFVVEGFPPAMPPFTEDQISQQDLSNIVAFFRSLSADADDTSVSDEAADVDADETADIEAGDEAADEAGVGDDESADADLAAQGREFLLSSAVQCAACHTQDDLGWNGRVGPPLNGIYDTAATRVEGLSAEEYIRQSIREPSAFVVEGFPPAMPPHTEAMVSEEQLDAIIAYFRSQSEEAASE
ncbi:MAG: cytochrome c oxidase subunit II [Chloroflexi bacterium]|nr:MAG: cytochrome c oxidase subunit II [Chloroflexota bacterium]